MKPLVEKYKPAKLADFTGLAPIKSLFAKFAATPYSSAWLLTGPAGVGKTTLAYAVAEQIGGQIHHIGSRTCNLETVGQVVEHCRCYPMFARSPWHIVIVDEADKMTAAAQLAFLSILDGTEAPENTVFIFTCNDTKGLEPRFKSRTRVIDFDLAPDSEAAVSFLTRVWKAETHAEVPDLAQLFTACDCNLRDALMRLEIKIAMVPDEAPKLAPRLGEWVKDWKGRSYWVPA